MFATANTVAHHRPLQNVAHAYAQVGVETGVTAASPHQLVQMLFDGLLDAVARARGALRERQIDAKGRAIGRAVRIVNEGLRSNLNLQQGGGLAADLDALYGYITLTLTEANLENNDAKLDECRRLVEPLREAWVAIAPNVAKVL